jgi:hypothetical protein
MHGLRDDCATVASTWDRGIVSIFSVVCQFDNEPTNRARLDENSRDLLGQKAIARVFVVFRKWYAIDQTPYRAVLPV